MGNTHTNWQMRLPEINKLLCRKGEKITSEEAPHKV